MKNKKIALILGRGIEGCGVTKNAVEFAKYHKNTKIFASADKKWPREKSMVIEHTKVVFANWFECCEAACDINQNFDACIVFSIPSTKHIKETQDNFVTFLQSITLPKAIVQVDHNSASITRNARLDDVCNSVNLLMTHSLTGSFAMWCEKNGVSTPITNMGVGFDYDSHRKQFWKPIEDQNSRALKWIGRCAMWKGPNEIISLHNNYLRSHNFITTLEGLEASVQSLLITHEDGFAKTKKRDVQEYIRGANRSKAKLHYDKEVPGSAPYLFPDYNHNDCMDRLSRTAFGSDLYHLKPHFYGNNIEYCHAEVVASGTVPIFHKHFGDNIIHRKTGDPATASHNSGTIWYDPLYPDITADMILALSKDLSARDERREQAFEFWKAHSSSSDVYDDIIAKTLGEYTPTKTKNNLEDFFG